MKIIYGILSDDSGRHYCYKPEIRDKWLIPSIKQCHKLNLDCEIIIITNDFSFKDQLSFATFANVNNYIDDDINWFKKNYVHLSTNQYDFEKNAILRYMILKNYCVRNNIDNFLHLEPDVLVFSNVIEDSIALKDYDVTLLSKMAAGCCFFNNAKKVLSDFVKFVINSYSTPQIDPKGFNMEEEKERYKYNIENNIGFGGVSDMHFWSLYWYLNQDKVLEQMNQNINGVVYQTHMMMVEDNALHWESEKKSTDDVNEIEIKKIEIKGNKCFGTYDNKKIEIKYLHCHGHSKLLINKFV